MNNNLKPITTIPPFRRFCMTIGELPTSYLETMTYYEMLLWFTKYLGETIIPALNNNGLAVQELQEKYVELKNYVDSYFENLDVTNEINNKLDEMVEDGTMEELISEYLQLQTIYTYDTVTDLKEASNLTNGMFAKTLGYHNYNDGGGAFYKIRTVTVSDNVDEMLILSLNDNNIVAELIIENTISVNQLGAYGDGTHNDTLIIQKALDTDYNVTFNSNSTYLVSKNSNLNFTDNDEPCLLINKEKNIYGNGAILLVENHGQGILEVNNCSNVNIQDLILVSQGDQLPLDGTTGLGEKGNSSAGYDTENIWGINFNNSYNTSNLTLHGNEGNPWGTFNDGYIGNAACGILIRNTAHNITISNCEIYGFNYAGICIGTHTEATNEIDECYDINILNNNIHDIYDGGIVSISGKNININNNNVHDIGHVNAIKTDTNQNPGYGISIKGSDNETSQCIITNNIINNCVRKGVDLHGGNKVIIDNNIINNCMVSGIFAQTQYVSNKSNIINVANNQVNNSSYATGQLNPIHIEGVINADNEDKTEKEVIVSNNNINNCGGVRAFIDVVTGKNVIITGNMINGKTSETTNYAPFGILLGLGGRQLSNNGIISNNLINVDNSINTGIIVNNINECIVANNLIKCGSDTETTHYMSNSKVVCYGNYNTNDKLNYSQLGLMLPVVSDFTKIGKAQLSIYGDSLYMTDENNKIGRIPRYISFMVEANSTSSPTITEIRGSEDYLDSVSSSEYGLSIALKNTNNNFNPVALFQMVSSEPITATNSTLCEYVYERTHSKNEIVLGVKPNGSSATHYAFSSCASGKMLVVILL